MIEERESLFRIDGLCNRGSRVVGHGVSYRTIFPDPGRAGSQVTLCGAEQREQNAGEGGRLSSGGVLPVAAPATPTSPSLGVPRGFPPAPAPTASAVSSAPRAAASASSGCGRRRRMGASRGRRGCRRRRRFPRSTTSPVSCFLFKKIQRWAKF